MGTKTTTPSPFLKMYQEAYNRFAAQVEAIEADAKINVPEDMLYPYLAGSYSAMCNIMLREMKYMVERIEYLEKDKK